MEGQKGHRKQKIRVESGPDNFRLLYLLLAYDSNNLLAHIISRYSLRIPISTHGHQSSSSINTMIFSRSSQPLEHFAGDTLQCLCDYSWEYDTLVDSTMSVDMNAPAPYALLLKNLIT